MWKTACVRDHFAMKTLKIKFYFVALQRFARDDSNVLLNQKIYYLYFRNIRCIYILTIRLFSGYILRDLQVRTE